MNTAEAAQLKSRLEAAEASAVSMPLPLRAEMDRLRAELATLKSTCASQEKSLAETRRQLVDSTAQASSLQDAYAHSDRSRQDAEKQLAALEQVRCATEQAELTAPEPHDLGAELASPQTDPTSPCITFSEAIRNDDADDEDTQMQDESRESQPVEESFSLSSSSSGRLIQVKREMFDARESAVVATQLKRQAEVDLEEESRKRQRAEDALEEEKDGAACFLCKDARADVVFQPCGHLICCHDCTQGLSQPDRLCPRCWQPYRSRTTVNL